MSGSFIEIIFPADLTISIAHTCSSVGHLCDVNGANNITVTLQSTLTSSITIVVENVTNANEAKQTDTFTFQTFYDGYDSLVDEVTSGITITLTARELTNSSITPTSLITYDLTLYDFAFLLSDPIPAGGYIEIIFPSTVST